jgi:hypothetical protein
MFRASSSKYDSNSINKDLNTIKTVDDKILHRNLSIKSEADRFAEFKNLPKNKKTFNVIYDNSDDAVKDIKTDVFFVH